MINVIRQAVYDKLAAAGYTVMLHSDHKDISYVDFKNAIKIVKERERMLVDVHDPRRIFHIEIDQSRLSPGQIVVNIYSTGDYVSTPSYKIHFFNLDIKEPGCIESIFEESTFVMENQKIKHGYY